MGEFFSRQVFEKSYSEMSRHYRREEKLYALKHNGASFWDPIHRKSVALEKTLYPSMLTDMGIPEDGSPRMYDACKEIVEVAFEDSPEALKKWVEKTDEPFFLNDDRDVRVNTIKRLAKMKLEGRRI